MLPNLSQNSKTLNSGTIFPWCSLTHRTPLRATSWRRHQMETFSALLAFMRVIHQSPVTLRKDNVAELWCFLWSALEPKVQQTMEMPVIWDALVLIIAPKSNAYMCIESTVYSTCCNWTTKFESKSLIPPSGLQLEKMKERHCLPSRHPLIRASLSLHRGYYSAWPRARLWKSNTKAYQVHWHVAMTKWHNI